MKIQQGLTYVRLYVEYVEENKFNIKIQHGLYFCVQGPGEHVQGPKISRSATCGRLRLLPGGFLCV